NPNVDRHRTERFRCRVRGRLRSSVEGRELSQAANAASRAVSELLEKIRHFKVALKSVTADTQSLRAEIRAAEKDLRVEKIEENLLTLSTR
ncbi:MAG: hypothetical protein ACE5LV_01920, partial [Candidatus Aminicenantales bacterium]